MCCEEINKRPAGPASPNVRRAAREFRAVQFSILRGTGILPAAEKHGQDAHATSGVVA
jgi:hypothetical protein